MTERTLADAKAAARGLVEAIAFHKRDCQECSRAMRIVCAGRREMERELAALRRDIRTWFAPGPDQGTLI